METIVLKINLGLYLMAVSYTHLKQTLEADGIPIVGDKFQKQFTGEDTWRTIAEQRVVVKYKINYN